MRRNVDLPAPFGPSSASTDPACTSRSRSRNTTRRAAAAGESGALEPSTRRDLRAGSRIFAHAVTAVASCVVPRYASATARSDRIASGVPCGDHDPEVEHVDVVAHPQHQSDVVIHEQDGGAGRGDGADALAEPRALLGVEAGGRFVEEQHLRFAYASARDRDKLALALTQLARRSITQRVDPDAQRALVPPRRRARNDGGRWRPR